MIVRIMGVGQFRLTDEDKEAVNSVDDKVMAAVESGDQAEFTAALKALTDLIRKVGAEVATDEFVGSDAIIPDPETSVAEARGMLTEEGLIPD